VFVTVQTKRTSGGTIVPIGSRSGRQWNARTLPVSDFTTKFIVDNITAELNLSNCLTLSAESLFSGLYVWCLRNGQN
jgi:hypothetical protein